MPSEARYKMTEVEEERRRRILLSVWAYAYEFEADSIVSDGKFDKESELVNPQIVTGNKLMDKFFKTKFDSCTGMWIYKHPERQKIKELYERHYRNRDDT